MSFGKAKILRFNDIKPCAPGPTAYNVIIKDKPKGPILSQAERYTEIKSPSTSDAGSTHSTPCPFRTPTLLKRRKAATFTIKSKPKQLSSQLNDVEILKEKLVELENKDAYIKDLQEQIEDFKGNMSDLEKERNQLSSIKLEFENQLENLEVEHKDRLKKMTEQFEEDISRTAEEKQKINEEVASIREQYNVLKEANNKEMDELKENCDKFQVLYNRSVEEYNKLVEEKDLLLRNKEEELRNLEMSCVEMQRKYSLEIEKLQKEHQNEMQEIEFEMLKTMTELQKEKAYATSRIMEMEELMGMEIKKLQKYFEEEKEQLLLESDAKIKQVEESFKSKLFTEAQLKETLTSVENTWKTKLENQEKQSDAILKECQAISEYNIIQCELEKNELKTKLTEKIEERETAQLKYEEIAHNYAELETNFKNLQCELSKVIIELNDVRKTLGEKLEHKNENLKRLAEERRAYEVTIKRSQVTIEVLKRRLINSDRDVEQLKKELSDSEAKILEYESRCMQLTNDLKQAQIFSDELEMQYESAIKLNTSEIQQLKAELVRKVDAYKTKAELTISKLKKEKETTRDIMQQLHEAYTVVDRIQSQVDHFETVNSEYILELEQAQNELQCHKDKVLEYEKRLEDMERTQESYIRKSEKYDELLRKFEQLEKENLENKKNCLQHCSDLEELPELKVKYNRQKEVNEKLVRKCNQLEKESCSNKKKIEEQQHIRETLDKVEAEGDMLLSRVHCLENELKEVSGKYTDLAGHQNTHQKIKHLKDLKTRNDMLIQNYENLELKMQKLKKENSDLKKHLRKTKVHGEGKENIASPNRSLNSNRVDSPLRDRN